MKLDVRAESLIEHAALWLGLAPTPLVETHIGATLARSVVAGVKLGFFDCLGEGPLTHTEIAGRCGVDQAAAELLLNALVACGYLTLTTGRYRLKPKSRKWLLRDSPNSIRDKILLQAIEWAWLAQLDDFVRTGAPLDFHVKMSAEDRDLYHRSMRALAGIAGGEVAWRTPVPGDARLMLDLGGSHGHYAAEICRRHHDLRAQVLDLPDAIDMAAPLLAAEAMGDRVVHLRGDVLQTDLGVDRYDLIFMANLAHHLDAEENQALAIRSARALRPGGFFVIQEPVRVQRPERGGQTAALLGLYFALQSRPNVRTWSTSEMAVWQRQAGLRPRRPVPLRTAPGWILQAARR